MEGDNKRDKRCSDYLSGIKISSGVESQGVRGGDKKIGVLQQYTECRSLLSMLTVVLWRTREVVVVSFDADHFLNIFIFILLLTCFFLYSFIHMCIHYLGHFSPLPPAPHSPHPLTSRQKLFCPFLQFC
jgi:hypothetical protein